LNTDEEENEAAQPNGIFALISIEGEKRLSGRMTHFDWIITFPKIQKAYEIDGKVFVSFINKGKKYFSITLNPDEV